MWDLPGPGIELVSPALAGRLLTAGPPGKSRDGGVLNREASLCEASCVFREVTEGFHVKLGGERVGRGFICHE